MSENFYTILFLLAVLPVSPILIAIVAWIVHEYTTRKYRINGNR